MALSLRWAFSRVSRSSALSSSPRASSFTFKGVVGVGFIKGFNFSNFSGELIKLLRPPLFSQGSHLYQDSSDECLVGQRVDDFCIEPEL